MCGGSKTNWTLRPCQKPHPCLLGIMILSAFVLRIPRVPASPRLSKSKEPLSRLAKTSSSFGSPDHISYGVWSDALLEHSSKWGNARSPLRSSGSWFTGAVGRSLILRRGPLPPLGYSSRKSGTMVVNDRRPLGIYLSDGKFPH